VKAISKDTNTQTKCWKPAPGAFMFGQAATSSDAFSVYPAPFLRRGRGFLGKTHASITPVSTDIAVVTEFTDVPMGCFTHGGTPHGMTVMIPLIFAP
jgi:hypothetical protein